GKRKNSRENGSGNGDGTPAELYSLSLSKRLSMKIRDASERLERLEYTSSSSFLSSSNAVDDQAPARFLEKLCIFFLPATAVIPLHNHPEMTVFSKLLLGTMHIKAYDWVDSLDSDYLTSPSKSRLAKLKADATFTAPCDTSVLYPTSGGNIHEFTAITPCAVLDVIGPPYSKDDGRDCSHYRDTPCNASLYDEEFRKIIDNAGGRYAWLEEIEIPEESEMDGIEYKGPQVFDSMA
ncbi:UNVERIFIED_CONTAM: Plant cysteine oxidase 2, partial [Sesamum angustifolium]